MSLSDDLWTTRCAQVPVLPNHDSCRCKVQRWQRMPSPIRHTIFTHEIKVCGLSLPLDRAQCLHLFRNGECVSSRCSTSASLGNTGTIPGLAGSASAASAVSYSKPINTLTPPVSDFIFDLLSALSRYTPPARSNSIPLPVNSLSIVSPVLRNVIMLPLSRTCSTDMIDLCSPLFLGAIWKSPVTLTPSRVRKQIAVRSLRSNG